MEAAAEKRWSVKVSDLQAFLKERGASVTRQDKAKLHAAAEIGTEVDPDGLSMLWHANTVSKHGA